MLKWLKQKPANGHEGVHGITTDDPLATIQVHPISSQPKTSFNKNSNSNEIYAVSRLNPLFEEEATQGPLSPGIHSGSSGYDSERSDDEGHIGQRSNDPGPTNPPIKLPNTTSQKQLFQNQEDILIQQEATTLVGSASTEPILNVIQQNPAFIKSIAVAVEPPKNGRPLDPIVESKVRHWKSVTAIPVPIRNIEPPARKPGDKLGAARLIQRSSHFVQSIRIVPTSRPSSTFLKRCNSHAHSTRHGASLVRKPSVTFSERVDVVDGKLVQTPRRLSADQDSIVTDSLLMMTSEFLNQNHTLDPLKYRGGGHVIPRAFLAEVSDDSDDSPDLDVIKRLHDDGFTSFSDSLSRNRIVKQVSTRSSVSPQPAPAPGEKNGEKLETETSTISRRPRNVSSSSKSPFGGIADHYAAAKEIAKEIESYAQGTTKSTRISLVKDVLLSSRGRGGVGLTPSSVSSPPWAGGMRRREDSVDGPTLVTAVVHLKSVVPPPPLPAPASSSTQIKSVDLKRGELVEETTRVQPQVYVKANDLANVTTTTCRTGPSHLGLSPTEHAANGSKSQPQLATSNRGPLLDLHSHYRQDEGQVQVPIYDALPPGTSSHLRSHSHDDSDSGNSTDRSPNQDHSGDEAHPKIQKSFIPNPITSVPNPGMAKSGANLHRQHSDIITSRKGPPSSGSPLASSHNNEKVMIVSGDSQNMVVDLSGVPPDLRDAIISGSAVMALPDELNQHVEAGYAMIAIPQDHEYEILPSPKPHAPHPLHAKDSKEEYLEGRDNYATKNLTQVWDSIQQKGKGKQRITTTVLQHHPNHDSHTTADFTIEGQPLARQTKRVKRLKTRRCCCRIIGIFIFLIAFLGVIVTLSLVYTKGKHYFGPV